MHLKNSINYQICSNTISYHDAHWKLLGARARNVSSQDLKVSACVLTSPILVRCTFLLHFPLASSTQLSCVTFTAPPPVPCCTLLPPPPAGIMSNTRSMLVLVLPVVSVLLLESVELLLTSVTVTHEASPVSGWRLNTASPA